MASDRSVLSNIRERVGLSSEAEWPDSLILKEIERGKQEINHEIQERLNNGGQVNLYDDEAAVDALKNFVALRMYHQKDSQNRSEKRGPKSISEIRRTKFEDGNLQEQSDQLIHNVQRLFDDGN